MKTRRIKLTQGRYAIVDADAYERLNEYTWCFERAWKNEGYATRHAPVKGTKKGRRWRLHWDVIGKPERGFVVDHVNGNRLDNRLSNLRIVSYRENNLNTVRRRRDDPMLGVRKPKNSAGYISIITINGKAKYLGTFPTTKQAHEAFMLADAMFRFPITRP